VKHTILDHLVLVNIISIFVFNPARSFWVEQFVHSKLFCLKQKLCIVKPCVCCCVSQSFVANHCQNKKISLPTYRTMQEPHQVLRIWRSDCPLSTALCDLHNFVGAFVQQQNITAHFNSVNLFQNSIRARCQSLTRVANSLAAEWNTQYWTIWCLCT